MENNTALKNNPAAYEKARLIHEAHESLRAADLIDERDDLNEASWTDWYDHTIPEVRDIKIVAGAMEVELARRRGEIIIKQGEQRGRDRSGKKSEVSDPDTSLSNAVRLQRSRDRALALESAAVSAYVKGEAKAARVPSVHGAVRVATLAKANMASKRKIQQFEQAQKVAEQSKTDIIAILGRLADGVRRSDPEITKIARMAPEYFLSRVRLIPWLTIDRTIEGTVFQIDEPLHAICESNRPRPELEFKSISGYLKELRAEIMRRRKNNHDEFMKRRWESLPISKREQTELLDWIQQQFDRLPTL
jgi:hypothetical protein